MHKNNIHNNKYDLEKLSVINPLLKDSIFTNQYGNLTIDFAKPKAVKNLNYALLKKHYNINFWAFSDDNLCPPIPSRVDYIHYLADLIPNTKKVTVLDIGTGATCIYPLLGNAIYNWYFIGTDIDDKSIKNAQKIVSKNNLSDKIQFRLQTDGNNILNGIVNPQDKFTVSMCNPPFYKSKEDAIKANNRKQKNLKINSTTRNFSGTANELWYKGGEKAFLHNYLYQSSQYKGQFEWFTSLVSKKELIKSMKKSLTKLNVKQFKIIEMKQGNKISHIIAWQF